MILKDWFGMLNQPNAPATFWLLTALRTACLVHNWFQTTQGYSTEELMTANQILLLYHFFFRFALWRFHVFRCVGSPSFVVIFWLGISGTCTTLRPVPPEIRCCWNPDSFLPSGFLGPKAKQLGEGTYGSVSSARRNKTEWIDMEKLDTTFLGIRIQPFVGTRRLGQCVLSRPCRRCNGRELVGDRIVCWSLRLGSE